MSSRETVVADPHDPYFFEIVLNTVSEGRAAILEARDGGRYMPTFLCYPRLSYFDSGIPNLTIGSPDTPTDYAKVLVSERGDYGGHIEYRDLPTFAKLNDYVATSEQLQRYFDPSSLARGRRLEEDLFLRLRSLGVGIFLGNIVARHLHTHGEDAEVSSGTLLPIYLPRERAIFEETLPVEILVPIALTPLDIKGRIQIGPTLFVEELQEGDQLSRAPQDWHLVSANECVVGGATHALVITNCSVGGDLSVANPGWDLASYPIERIEVFFSALRLAAGVPTGYAQLVMRPLGWAHDYTADLPPLMQGPRLRSYPEYFDRHEWLRRRSSVPSGAVHLAGSITTSSSTAPERIQLSLRKFGSSLLRTAREDMLLDLCVALEALLGDGSQEMTYKLALRTAGVCGLSDAPPTSPSDAFRNVKKIYAYRSALVHGDPSAEKKATIRVGDESLLATSLAFRYVRSVLLFLLDHPDLLGAGMDAVLLDTSGDQDT